MQHAATAQALTAAATDVIDGRIAALAHDDGLAEYRPARHAAVRTLVAWTKSDRAVVVDITGGNYRHMAAEVLDTASAQFDLGPAASIIDLPTGAMLIW
ncbi:hypothetical protein [Actinomadura violacea]|uniref:Uncharacterized protein n=1 Tax=Actinomadura violacea TaxID=2819934 RepID=A0ABS3RXX9_9ACTN|nr:hypothetical protein [Actinomadura violacea]MBO2461621.1 hypothetical protein [Actinomadura violacea]